VAYDAFVKQWFQEVVVPEYTLTDAKKNGSASTFDVTVKVTNKGKATMPVTIAAAKGERFDDKGVAKADYRDARTALTLAAGESKDVTVHCDFDPDRVVVDPDVLVLQLRRKTAVAKL
jgi:hypothetical protein